MWKADWRSELPRVFERDWDIVIVGGGITGAGILLEAARHGLRALLVEQRDFAWGASSRSSKLVHGGLRYLKQGKILLTRAAVHERELLLREAAGLVESQSFAFPHYHARKPSRWVFSLGLALYDLLAGRKTRRNYSAEEFEIIVPGIDREGLEGGSSYMDAKTDDSRLVVRVLEEAVTSGGVAVNYVRAGPIVRSGGNITGIDLRDELTDTRYFAKAKLVINATGAWADMLREEQGGVRRLRPLRGSHLVISNERLPVTQAVSFLHPRDGRPVFVFPWEGISLVGTTDVDHDADMSLEARITPLEVSYLLEAIDFQFPKLGIGVIDIMTTFAGVRPVVSSGKSDPSKEARDAAIWLEDGLLTVTGGKLTTFRLTAIDALKKAAPLLSGWDGSVRPTPVFSRLTPELDSRLNSAQLQRLQGRYGRRTAQLLNTTSNDELVTIPGTETLWAELRWSAASEAVVHLEDLMLRRTRLGLQLRDGGADVLPRVRELSQKELGWSDDKWSNEVEAYLTHWNTYHNVPAMA
jgi:glycerol-3-phosphate dehydrogenase